MQLWKLKAATQAQVAAAFGVIPVSVWRWEKALAAGGVAGLVPDRKGPRRPSKLTPGVVARIRELDGQGLGKAGIAAAAGVSESSVRNVLRPAGAGGGDSPGGGAAGPAAEPVAGRQAAAGEETAGGQQEALPVLPDPVARDAERALARFGLLGQGAVPVFTPGARCPLAGLLLA
ncbi:MAG: helix-turn-helix domain-containing protein, partial [Streptosporangiaceae bacterium]